MNECFFFIMSHFNGTRLGSPRLRTGWDGIYIYEESWMVVQAGLPYLLPTYIWSFRCLLIDFGLLGLDWIRVYTGYS